MIHQQWQHMPRVNTTTRQISNHHVAFADHLTWPGKLRRITEVQNMVITQKLQNRF